MNEPNKSYDIVRQEVLSGTAAPGSILARVMSDLSPTDLQALRQKAAEGMLALELQKLQMQNKFQASSSELDDFIYKMNQLERQHRGTLTTFKGRQESQGATGTTTITVSKGSCLLLLAGLASAFFVLLVMTVRFVGG